MGSAIVKDAAPHRIRVTPEYLRDRRFFSVKGTMRRPEILDRSRATVKRELTRLMGFAGIPQARQATVQLVSSEIVANWYKHNEEGDLTYTLVVRPLRVSQFYLYKTEPFFTEHRPPRQDELDRIVDDFEDERSLGMGIAVIRGLCQQSYWRFNAGNVRISIVNEWAEA